MVIILGWCARINKVPPCERNICLLPLLQVLTINLFFISGALLLQPQTTTSNTGVGAVGQNPIPVNKNNNYAAPKLQQSTTREQQVAEGKQEVDDILRDTFLMLDVLDEKLGSVSNGTPSALMRDNLRALERSASEQPVEGLRKQKMASASKKQHYQPRLNDEELVKLADSFSSHRRLDDNDDDDDDASSSSISSGSNTQDDIKAQASGAELTIAAGGGQKVQLPAEQLYSSHLMDLAASDPSQTPPPSGSPAVSSREARQMWSAAAGATGDIEARVDSLNQLENDSTERHIKFTLDLMRAIFASQSYSARTNSIESFLVSPLSIQMVLMMMHAGARGQTKREISNCLYLTTPAPSSSSSQPTVSGPAGKLSVNSELSGEVQAASMPANPKLKRRHHQTAAAAAGGKSSTTTTVSSSSSTTTAQPPARQQQNHAANQQNNVHELFGAAMRNLLKDPIVMKALTSANQILLQKNLPLAAHFEWAMKHYYAADLKLVDFQHTTTDGNGGEQNNNGATNHSSAAAAAAASESQAAASSRREGQGGGGGGEQLDNNIQQMVNEWVERQTRGRISNFLSAPVPSSTLLMAINVLFFKGDWQYKFDPADTQADAFFTLANGRTVRTPMMVNKLPLAFAYDAQLKTSVIELPYKAQRLGLFLLLPDDTAGIFHTMHALNSTVFANLISSMRKPVPGPSERGPGGINVRIPKFSIESTPRLSQILSQQLGLKTLFSPDLADLSAIFAPPTTAATRRNSNGSGTLNNSTILNRINNQQASFQPPQVGLDDLLHKAVLQVDEQGSVAAASSATIVERVGLFNGNYFEADHPFLLFLIDKQTGLVLFSGAFAGPNNNNRPDNSNNGSSSSNSNSSQTANNTIAAQSQTTANPGGGNHTLING